MGNDDTATEIAINSIYAESVVDTVDFPKLNTVDYQAKARKQIMEFPRFGGYLNNERQCSKRYHMAKPETRRERRTFNDEYKQQVLELIRVGDKSISQICRDLDLTESTVRKWIKADQASNGIMTQNSPSETADQQELV